MRANVVCTWLCLMMSTVCLVACGDEIALDPNVSLDAGDGATTEHHSVGGTVEGLVGDARVRLQLNDADPIEAGNGPFAFGTALASGTAYHVSLSAPAEHSCSVSGGDGVVGASDVGDIRVNCMSAHASLAGLVPSVGTLEPAFDPAITSYKLVGKLRAKSSFSEGDSLSVTATSLVAAANVRVGGVEVPSGVPSPATPYAAGAHRLEIVVTAPDGSTTTTYAIDAEASVSTYVKPRSTSRAVAFGAVVAVSEDTLVVGARSDGAGIGAGPNDTSAPDSGAVYVFVREHGAWREQAYLKASNSREGANFGSSVALSGDRLVVGAPVESSAARGVDGNQADTSAPYAGAAYVFVRENGVWRQEAYLKASNTRAGSYDQFGTAVAVSGDTVVVGAYGEASNATGVDGDQANTSAFYAGAAYVFVRENGGWRQQAYLKAPNTSRSPRFGQAVAVSGDTVVVGSPSESSSATGVDGDPHYIAPSPNTASQSGAAWVFVRENGVWRQQAYLKASNARRGAYLGRSVAVEGDTIVVGSPNETSGATGVNGDENDTSATSAGAAYVFVRESGAWRQQAYLKASNTSVLGVDAKFGQAVSLSAGRVVVGAPGEWSRATGIDGGQKNTASGRSGAAYVFVRQAGAWRQQSYVKASNTRSLADFGSSVALFGATLAVGSPNESSAATGIDGDEVDTSLSGSGAVYVY